MQYLEKDQDHQFHTCELNIHVLFLFQSVFKRYFLFNAGMYYMLVTIATVGYGDITPATVLGR